MEKAAIVFLVARLDLGSLTLHSQGMKILCNHAMGSFTLDILKLKSKSLPQMFIVIILLVASYKFCSWIVYGLLWLERSYCATVLI